MAVIKLLLLPVALFACFVSKFYKFMANVAIFELVFEIDFDIFSV